MQGRILSYIRVSEGAFLYKDETSHFMKQVRALYSTPEPSPTSEAQCRSPALKIWPATLTISFRIELRSDLCASCRSRNAPGEAMRRYGARCFKLSR